MGLSNEEISKQYRERETLYLKLIEEVKKQLNYLLSEKDVKLAFPIEARVKELQSILKKCENKNLELNNISEIGDIAGFRIIVLFRSDIEIVSQILKENFEIFKKEDAHDRLSENEFGYSSVHFDATLKEEWCSTPTCKDLKDLKMEIQLRTASQHIWAASSHTLQYKKEEQIPMELRRVVNRAAALLELVDLEFERVLIERENYVSKISENDENEVLNIETLKNVMDKMFPPENKEADEDYALILSELYSYGIKNLNDLIEIIDKNLDYAVKRDKEYVNKVLTSNSDDYDMEHRNRAKHGIYFTHLGLIRTIMRKDYPKKQYTNI
ncbi:ppGpp synthetase/RelA/SpoT-type nucleotidyltransferase [Methanococcus maripaludis]|uniref:protein adenylyltransferase n=1 Tax=Methanococcus maripaludis TaxID=39152 RepID=A0A7J9NVZ3_METMI|nr:hypothetical protein [Methanococcus maripaludis]MBA2851163.1 ppGpp synthetase/RelA/SpoT-type nucleotidyltransferase [Methanococcus maripaludis]